MGQFSTGGVGQFYSGAISCMREPVERRYPPGFSHRTSEASGRICALRRTSIQPSCTRPHSNGIAARTAVSSCTKYSSRFDRPQGCRSPYPSPRPRTLSRRSRRSSSASRRCSKASDQGRSPHQDSDLSASPEPFLASGRICALRRTSIQPSCTRPHSNGIAARTAVSSCTTYSSRFDRPQGCRSPYPSPRPRTLSRRSRRSSSASRRCSKASDQGRSPHQDSDLSASPEPFLASGRICALRRTSIQPSCTRPHSNGIAARTAVSSCTKYSSRFDRPQGYRSPYLSPRPRTLSRRSRRSSSASRRCSKASDQGRSPNQDSDLSASPEWVHPESEKTALAVKPEHPAELQAATLHLYCLPPVKGAVYDAPATT